MGEAEGEDVVRCSHCGRDDAPKYYGSKGQHRFCTLNKCKKAHRAYLARLTAPPPTATTTTSSRKRPADDEPNDSSVVAPPARISQVFSCLGIRCAPCPAHQRCCTVVALSACRAQRRRVAADVHLKDVQILAAFAAALPRAADLAADALAATALAIAALAFTVAICVSLLTVTGCRPVCCRFCNVSQMSEARLWNKLTQEEYKCEYLMYGRFHLPPADDGFVDEMGYRSKRWTSLEALEEMEWEQLHSPLGTFLAAAKGLTDSFAQSFQDSVETEEADSLQ